MPYLKNESTPEMKAAVVAIEQRADDCYKRLRILNQPRNIAMWGLLTSMAKQLEVIQQKHGPTSRQHTDARINIERNMCGFHFIDLHAKPDSRLVPYTFTSRLADEAALASNVCGLYTHFLNIFPLWHKNHQKAEFMPNGILRFFIPNDSVRQRQVIAYQQISRPAEMARGLQAKNKESAIAKALLNDLFHEVRGNQRLDKKFSYEAPRNLIDALRPQYVQRLDDNFRHPSAFVLNGYRLGEFKQVYVELLVHCAIHEYICYPFDKPGYPIPDSSLVVVKARAEWTKVLSKTSRVSAGVCEAIINDLTLRPGKAPPFTSLCITPFVPLDKHGWNLAVAPQFPLMSAVDENILRQFSYTYPDFFSGQNIHKENSMRDALRSAKQPHWGIEFSIELPGGTTEIDAVIEDTSSSTVVFAEMKWIRKPYRPLGRIDREADVNKGISQLGLIRTYGRTMSDDLRKRGKLSHDLKDYQHIHYILLVRDYWHWVEPDDGIAILDFDECVEQLKTASSLHDTMKSLLSYEWLPIEDKDFHVGYRAISVNGASFESSTFYRGVAGQNK